MVLRWFAHPTPHAEETSKLSVIPSTDGPPGWDRQCSLFYTIANANRHLRPLIAALLIVDCPRRKHV
uniref:Uncharacterized protein n=1 Tax=Cucumis melo TaxID=3656 RepID=A0A9I9DVU6_CUCME